ncbi:hypothetical protein C8N24_1313 [Solirubrobacter pauli]|uniref:MinD-like ATPase involved in chromosome partitioning or flagellar assembly n=1 Tax=Solirubrobacter pauli TaxID=166793 RepID=A0A660LFJ7_9ACTN|nr:hypothetical protein [Solirubrobacter pauli]RKQ91491.1 hypothetical protein C8N24_1313 [Solirubrobacter pauli]
MIYTFYSYKGGVGRSMALANVAEWLYLTAGLRVVIVDWDLEAPGLEAFFPSDGRPAAVARQPGLIDLLLEYKADLPYLDLPPEADQEATVKALSEQLTPLRSRVFPLRRPVTRPDGRTSGVWILPAGRRAGESFTAYSDAVQDFDWNGFYARSRGHAFFEWLRRQLVSPDLADVALIDARTGFSEMGGVATRQLADVIVSLCVLNSQNIEGVRAMTASFARPEVLAARGRPLMQLVVPTRTDNNETDALNFAKGQFERQTSDLLPEPMRGRRTFWDLRIPYVPKYAYTERLAVGASDANEDLVAAYTRLATQLIELAPAGAAVRATLHDDRARELRSTVALAQVTNVPARLPLLVGREGLLSDLRSRFAPAGTPIVLYGLGGAGKTALAIEFAHRFTADYRVAWWIDASSPERVAQGYVQLAAALGVIPGHDPIAYAREWFAAHEGWLLVLDGAEHPDVLEPLMPRERRGHVLITSRSPRWTGIATAVEVPVLAVDDAVDLVRRRTGESEPAMLEGLARALGEHPLALEEACAYMEATGRSIGSFRERYADEGARFLQRAGEQRGTGHALAALWLESYREVLRDPPARDLLGLLSVLGSESVPVEAITCGAPVTAARFLWEPATVDEAVIKLRQFSFVAAREGGLQVHGLLAAFVRMWLGEDLVRHWTETGVGVLSSALARSEAPDELVLAHAQAVVDRTDDGSTAAIELLDLLAGKQEELGRIPAAAATLEEAVRRSRLHLGDRWVERAMRARLMLLIRTEDLQGARAVLQDDVSWAAANLPKLRQTIAVDLAVVLLRSNEYADAQRIISAVDIPTERVLVQVLLWQIAFQARRTGAWSMPRLDHAAQDSQATVQREVERILGQLPLDRIADGFLRADLFPD